MNDCALRIANNNNVRRNNTIEFYPSISSIRVEFVVSLRMDPRTVAWGGSGGAADHRKKRGSCSVPGVHPHQVPPPRRSLTPIALTRTATRWRTAATTNTAAPTTGGDNAFPRGAKDTRPRNKEPQRMTTETQPVMTPNPRSEGSFH